MLALMYTSIKHDTEGHVAVLEYAALMDAA